MAYISVSDAVEKTGRGHTTIYRLCRRFERTKHIKREDRKFLIDEEFLSDHFSDPQSDSQDNSDSAREKPRQELVDMFILELQKEKEYYRQLLDRKDEQLLKKDEIILKLQDRQADLYHLLHHHTRLIDKLRSSEPEALNVTDVKPENQPEVPDKKEEPNPVPAENKTRISVFEAKIVYGVLTAVGLILLLAVLFADELRALSEN